jgi:hypothetical protein
VGPLGQFGQVCGYLFRFLGAKHPKAEPGLQLDQVLTPSLRPLRILWPQVWL